MRLHVNRNSILLVLQHGYLVGVEDDPPLRLLNTVQLHQLLAEVLAQLVLGHEQGGPHANLKRSSADDSRLFEACVGSCGLYHRPGDRRLPNKAYDGESPPQGASIALHHHGDSIAPAEAYGDYAAVTPSAFEGVHQGHQAPGAGGPQRMTNRHGTPVWVEATLGCAQ